MFLRYAFLADTVSLDAGGKLSVIGIFERILTTQIPCVHRDLTLVANFEGNISEKGQHKAIVELRDSKGNKLGAFEQQIGMEAPGVTHSSLTAGLILKMQDLPFQQAGQYEFVLFVDDRFLGRIPFLVQQLHVKKTGEA
jgi:hypothetical protein